MRLPGWLALLLMLLGGPASASAIEVPRLTDASVLAPSTGDLPEIRKRKFLRALVTYSRTDFAIMPDGRPLGLQVELLRQYENMLNRGVRREVDRVHIILIPTTFDRLLPDLLAGRGDIAASLLTVTRKRKRLVAFATGEGMGVNEILVTGKHIQPVPTIEALAGRTILVLRNSSYAEHLRALNRRLLAKGKRPIKVREADAHLLSEDILDMVNAGIVDMTVIDDYKARAWAPLLPNIRLQEDIVIKRGNAIGWAVRRNNPQLLASLSAFARTVRQGTLLGNMLFKRYYNAGWLKNPLADDKLSRFRKAIRVFERYAPRYGFDPLAVAAQAFQESGLDQRKRSPRGAIGILQVLPSTAADRHVRIENIHTLDGNVHAALKYMAFLRDHYFSAAAIRPLDRLAFTWAAYNAGPAKVQRMRALARDMGLNPNVWFGQVELAAARLTGRETVRYVRNIFKYYLAYQHLRSSVLGRAK